MPTPTCDTILNSFVKLKSVLVQKVCIRKAFPPFLLNVEDFSENIVNLDVWNRITDAATCERRKLVITWKYALINVNPSRELFENISCNFNILKWFFKSISTKAVFNFFGFLNRFCLLGYFLFPKMKIFP